DQVLTFRIEHYDQLGNRRDPVVVEMRGRSISGQIADGDEVEVGGRWRRGVLQATKIRTTSGATVSARSGQAPMPVQVIGAIFFLIFFLAAFGFLAVTFFKSVIQSPGGPWGP